MRNFGYILIVLGSAMLAGWAAAETAPKLERFSYAELHMGSMFQLTFYAANEAEADRAAEAAFQRVAALDDIMSDYNPNSELVQLCRQPVGVPTPLSRDLYTVLTSAQNLARKSKGAFDVTAGPFTQQWRQARKTRVLPTAEQIAETGCVVGYRKLRLNHRDRTATLLTPGMALDLGGIAKGYAADEALAVLRHTGIRQAMVAASGDIVMGDPPPGKKGWEIGIQSIDQTGQGLTQTVTLSHAGISTSGDTEQYVEIQGKRYSHIVDPKTGLGLTERIGVTIIAPNGTTSDSLATAVSVLGAKRGMALVERWPKVAALIVRIGPAGKQVIESQGFRKILRI